MREIIVSIALLICILADLYYTCRLYFQSRRLERENEELKAEIERKDRLLQRWEEGVTDISYLKRLQTMSEEEKKIHLMGNWTYTSHPCERCDTGWAGVDGDEVFHTCKESCERLAAWNEKQKKED